jgi:hypothetical protein
MLMTPWIEATSEILGFEATTEAPAEAGMTSYVQVKLRAKRGKGFSGSFPRSLVFGWIGFASPNVIWAFFLVGLKPFLGNRG